MTTGDSLTTNVDDPNGIGTTTMELASAASAGTLSGLGTQFVGFSAITIDSGANWTLSGANTLAAGITLTDSGTLSDSGTLTNAGLITGAATGVTDHISIAFPEAGVLGRIESCIHAGEDGEVTCGRQSKLALRPERGGIGLIGLENFVVDGHSEPFLLVGFNPSDAPLFGQFNAPEITWPTWSISSRKPSCPDSESMTCTTGRPGR